MSLSVERQAPQNCRGAIFLRPCLYVCVVLVEPPVPQFRTKNRTDAATIRLGQDRVQPFMQPSVQRSYRRFNLRRPNVIYCP